MHMEHGMFGLLTFHVNVNSAVLASAISKSHPHISLSLPFNTGIKEF